LKAKSADFIRWNTTFAGGSLIAAIGFVLLLTELLLRPPVGDLIALIPIMFENVVFAPFN